mmetsp:Transcript_33810/g.93400  ORF Transcript_33810/g.93400 Transcript_33810/m.93400 type:complete len:266 (+) Transcript_33810:489-1286(+)
MHPIPPSRVLAELSHPNRSGVGVPFLERESPFPVEGGLQVEIRITEGRREAAQAERQQQDHAEEIALEAAAKPVVPRVRCVGPEHLLARSHLQGLSHGLEAGVHDARPAVAGQAVNLHDLIIMVLATAHRRARHLARQVFHLKILSGQKQIEAGVPPRSTRSLVHGVAPINQERKAQRRTREDDDERHAEGPCIVIAVERVEPEHEKEADGGNQAGERQPKAHGHSEDSPRRNGATEPMPNLPQDQDIEQRHEGHGRQHALRLEP